MSFYIAMFTGIVKHGGTQPEFLQLTFVQEPSLFTLTQAICLMVQYEHNYQNPLVFFSMVTAAVFMGTF